MGVDKRKKLKAQLSAYLDGELSAEQCAEVEAFLADDAEARQLLAELRATIQLVQDLPRAKASDELLEGLRSQLERRALLSDKQTLESPPPMTTPFEGKWIAVAAVIVLTFAAAYFMWSFTDQDQPTGGIRQQYVLRQEPRKISQEPRSLNDSIPPQPPAKQKVERIETGHENEEMLRSREKGRRIGYDLSAGMKSTKKEPDSAKSTPGEKDSSWAAEQIQPSDVREEGTTEVERLEDKAEDNKKKETFRSLFGKPIRGFFAKIQPIPPTTRPAEDESSTLAGRTVANQPVALIETKTASSSPADERAKSSRSNIEQLGVCTSAPASRPTTQSRPAATSQPGQ